jgi:hypothetical protein
MRNLVLVILTAALGWSAYWYLGVNNRETALTNWFDEREQAGWVAQSTVNLRGYPNRYDAIIEGIELADPITGWAWYAPRFELLQMSYKRNHFIALWPETQTIKTPYERITINSDDMRASVVFHDETELSRATLSAKALNLHSTADWGAATQEFVLALRETDGVENSYDLGLNANDLMPSNTIMRHLDHAGILPKTFQTFRMDASATFSDKLSQASFENNTANLQSLKLNDIHIAWGDLALRATGNITLDTDGYPTGKLTIRATNWEQMLDIAIGSGAVREGEASAIRTALKIFSAMSGNRNELEIPLNFKDRQTNLGPISIGNAPRLKFP